MYFGLCIMKELGQDSQDEREDHEGERGIRVL